MSAEDDVTQFFRLIDHCRKNGYRIGSVKLGSLSLQIEDLRIDDHEGLKPNEHQPRSPWADAGLADGIPSDGTVG
jgi:hypothetical protein